MKTSVRRIFIVLLLLFSPMGIVCMSGCEDNNSNAEDIGESLEELGEDVEEFGQDLDE